MTHIEALRFVRKKLIYTAVAEAAVGALIAGYGLWLYAVCTGVGLAATVYSISLTSRMVRAAENDDASSTSQDD